MGGGWSSMIGGRGLKLPPTSPDYPTPRNHLRPLFSIFQKYFSITRLFRCSWVSGTTLCVVNGISFGKAIISRNILLFSPTTLLLSLESFLFNFFSIPWLQGKYEVRWRELYSEFVIKYSEMTLPHFWRGGNCSRDRRRRNLHISQIKYSQISHFWRH